MFLVGGLVRPWQRTAVLLAATACSPGSGLLEAGTGSVGLDLAWLGVVKDPKITKANKLNSIFTFLFPQSRNKKTKKKKKNAHTAFFLFLSRNLLSAFQQANHAFLSFFPLPTFPILRFLFFALKSAAFFFLRIFFFSSVVSLLKSVLFIAKKKLIDRC